MMEIVKTFLVFVIYVVFLLAAALVLWGIAAASGRFMKAVKRRTPGSGGKGTEPS